MTNYYYCSTCGTKVYGRNKEGKHFTYAWKNRKCKCGRKIGLEQVVVVCGKLLTERQKELADIKWDINHPKECRSCDGRGYIIIGGTESENCHCRPNEFKKQFGRYPWQRSRSQ